MADIALRFHKDMLVCTTELEALLESQRSDFDADIEMMTFVEPEVISDAYRIQMSTQAQCLVAQTSHLLPAKLLHKNAQDKLADLVSISLELANQQKPQHVLVELGPTGLPLDPSSKASLMENRDQYVRAAREFEKHPFDAYLLTGFEGIDMLRCALMGLRKVSDKPVFACVVADQEGLLPNGDTIEQAAAVMNEYGAAVAGIQTGVSYIAAAKLVKRMSKVTQLPLMAQLQVVQRNTRQLNPTDENPYYRPETMFDAIPYLRSAGAQFLRAAGQASPAYAGALAAVVRGLDVIDVRGILQD